ncbi:ATP-binding SpoIIE family protein phosphatase [Solemya velum gill symbiont]|uniref:Serine phosphatase RsbU n=1 Tax=Solemya velum gill symbiont TaxID=2340 RepID=A0A0B0H6R3_SOVGS|nr:SpoIIE family protein phosphatase [Solemya velum gill symbiont]KHF25848.1 serine phosphatase RsbU [Solemya velum gill symbiont]OOY99132.1 hypothetical protein BOW19_05865 [Solemya velum gill symbiont]OOZ00350.1 hypothetical protein BOW20_09615 [Solemya velum gill symbiont]OOZ03587.1 hypothetical protein BOW21_05735 [Solemya velum gill symbiont]OOZ05845.1 hypothetical protein BOW22_05715 [Solemya velum gill symbiont]
MEKEQKELLADKIGGLGQAHIEVLADMAQSFAESLDIDDTLRTALRKTMQYLDAEAGSVFLLVDNDEILECRASEGPVDITGLRLPAGQGIVGQTVQENDTLIIRDVSKSKSFNVAVDEDTGFQTRSILCAPLTVRGERLGALELINKQGSDGLFSDRDRSFLSALASSAALAMLNARMAADLVEQEKVRKELEMAREIQNSLLPPMPPQDAPIHGLNIPARGVSGDLYLFFPLSNGRLFFALGDVSGKGIHAALFMAKTVSLIRALAKLEHSPGKLFARLNDEIRETASRGMFITLAAGTFDPASGKVCMTNAGHEPPLFRNIDGEYVAYPADAPPLGILPDLVFEEVEIMLEGGALYLFTDGMTEGFDSEGQALGVAGVKAAIEQHQNLNPQARIQAMVEPLTDTDTQLRDDITLLVVEHQPIQVLAKIEVSALPTNLKGLRDGLREVLVENEIDKALVEKLVLAVGEAVMNVVQHGFDGGGAEGRITLEVCKERDGLLFRLMDNAPSMDPAEVTPRDLDDIRPGGLGTHFIRELMDSVEFMPPPAGSGNLLEMRKRIELL